MNSHAQIGASANRLFLCLALAVMASTAARAASLWERPAGQLAEQVAALLGPGPAQLIIGNRSTLVPADVTAIRRLLEQDLRAYGIESSAADSANQIRVTLSENVRERLWVAEVIEGNRIHVVMVRLDRDAPVVASGETGLILKKTRIWNSLDVSIPSHQFSSPVLAALETQAGLVVLEKEEIILLSKTASGWREEKRFRFDTSDDIRRPLSRDPRGLLTLTSDGNGFTAFTAGMECSGTYAPPAVSSEPYGQWSVRCRASDDPWPVAGEAVAVKAFYNAARNYFTGVVIPSLGVDLMPFYTLAVLPRSTPNVLSAAQPAILVNSIDGKTLLAERGTLKAVSGTRDWDSDFAAIRSGCGPGMQIVASGSGEAINDSLRAYDLSAQEAIATSAPLDMGGTVTALWTTSDGANVWAVVRKNNNEYEVDRVTALCP
jgi:hypothetical protein